MSVSHTDRTTIIQFLASFRRAGVTHIPASPADAELPAVPLAQAAPPDGDTIATEQPEAMPRQSLRTESQPVQAAASLVPDNGTLRNREERETALSVLADRVAACVRCSELAATRRQTVFGVGNPEARFMFIGEAPGADEDLLGEPFVGRAGKLLDKIIEACRLKREEIYICNILRCRPPGNRNPTSDEADNCREYLDGQIAIVDPEYIVCWGSVAAQNLLDVRTPIGKMRGKFFSYGRAKVACTYHTSYLLRNPSAKKLVWEDMKFIMNDTGLEL